MPDPTTHLWLRHLPAGVRWQDVDVIAERTLPGAWSARWEEDPSRKVLRDERRGWLSAGELADATALVAGRLSRAGLQRGDRLVMSLPTSLDMAIAHVAALRMGLVVVPCNTAYRRREVGNIVADTSPSGAVVDETERGRWVEEAADGNLVITGPDVDLPEGPAPELDTSGPSDLAIIGYTSGTTGAPKGAMLTHANLLATAASLVLAWRWTPDDRLVLALPLFHLHGLGVGLHGTLLAGASSVLQDGFDPEQVLDAAQSEKASLFFGVPTMYARLVRSPRVAEMGGLRMCASGSAPLPADLHGRIRQASGQVVIERYGMTETLITISNPYEGERRPGSVGFPLPGVEMRLSDGSGGEILIKGPSVFAGYWRQERATAEAFDEEGWMRTGDLATLDSDGYVTIVGRSKELIITGGYNVYPREVEDVFLSHPGVQDVAVVGQPSEEWGEVVVAYVVPDGALDREELSAFAAAQLAPYKRPKVVNLIDELPRNALGKVLKHEL